MGRREKGNQAEPGWSILVRGGTSGDGLDVSVRQRALSEAGDFAWLKHFDCLDGFDEDDVGCGGSLEWTHVISYADRPNPQQFLLSLSYLSSCKM